MASARTFVAAALALALCARSEAAEPFSEGIVSLTFDDGLMTQFQNARPLLASHGFRATFYVNLWGGRHMTAVEATALLNDGHEIGSHTKGHNHLTEISDEHLLDEIRGSQEDLMTRLGLDDVPSFAFPYGEYDERVLRVVMQYYESSRTTWRYHNYRDTNRYELGEYGIGALAVMKPLIDEAIAQRSWLILGIHDVEVGTPIYGGVRVSDFAEVLDYLRDRGVRVLTVSEAVALMNVSGPALVGVSPVSGPASGGNVVTLSGARFADGATVRFGGVLANVVARSSTSIEVVAPPHAPSTVDVVVTNPDGQRSTLAAAYTFDPPPTISSVSPASGLTAGGTPVTLTGSGFVAGATVSFGSQPAGVVSITPTSIVVIAPTHVAGSVDVVVVNPDGQFSAPGARYTFETFEVLPSPLVIAAAPTATPPRGTIQFSVSGGSGSGYVWFLAANSSGGSVDAAGVYTAGSAGNATDLIQVADSRGSVATALVAVGPGVSIASPAGTIAPHGTMELTASGGSGSYAWSLATSASGGSIAAGGTYTAGAIEGVDVVRVVDSLGNVATGQVVVTAAGARPAPPSSGGCGQPAGASALLLVAVLGALRSRAASTRHRS